MSPRDRGRRAASTRWMEPLAPRSGPLLAVARRFSEGHPGAPGGPQPCTLASLAAAIDRWAELDEVGSEDDESFVEGAGALLGMLLLQRIDDGAHVQSGGTHRLRLGADGFFDPFGAVEQALEGPSAQEVLGAAVARAHAEAQGRAGVGRAIRLLREHLGTLPRPRSIASHFGPDVVLDDGVEIDLRRLLGATEAEPDRAADKAVAKLVSMLPGAASREVDADPEAAWRQSRARLLPRLAKPGFSAALAADGRAGLASRPLFGGAVELTFVLSYEDRARYVRADEIESWGRSADEVLARAVANVAERSASARFARLDTDHGALVVARSGDGLDGARLLLPSLHDVLSPELGSPFYAAVPHRDALWACACGDERLREALRARVRDDAARAPHGVSEHLFLVGPEGVRS